MLIPVHNLKKGNRFSFSPAAWFGPAVVRESYVSGDLWCVKFDAVDLVNPPGVFYGDPDTKVRLLRPAKG
jgi:hypothetical protein